MPAKPRIAPPLHPLLVPLNRHGTPAHPLTNDARRKQYRARQIEAQRDPVTKKPTIYRNRLATRVMDGMTVQMELQHSPSTTARALRVAARVRAELKAGAL